VVTPDLALENAEIIPTTQIAGKDASDRLLEVIEQYKNKLPVEIDAVCMGFPSTINRDRTVVLSTPNIEGFDNLSIIDRFEAALQVPVLIEKDTCMLMHYDLNRHDISDGILVGYYIGTGLGNIILIDGKTIVGKDGVAGELGHIPILDRHDKCGCGLEGCSELYVAGLGLERLQRKRFPNTPIADVFTVHGQTEDIRYFIESMAKIIVTEINILNPHYIILGGGVIGMADFPYDLLLSYIYQFTRKPLPGDRLNIIRSDFSNPYNGVIGAALYARKKLEERQK
jgi:allose kinase